jgi:hypothetical protein
MSHSNGTSLRKKLRRRAKEAQRRKLCAAIDVRRHHRAELASVARGT